MEHENLFVFIVRFLFITAVIFGGSEVLSYMIDHTSTYTIAVFTALYLILLGSLFYIYFKVSKFETVEKVKKAIYFLGIFDVICMVIVQIMEFDISTIGMYIMSFYYLGHYSLRNAELHEKGDQSIEYSGIPSSLSYKKMR